MKKNQLLAGAVLLALTGGMELQQQTRFTR